MGRLNGKMAVVLGTAGRDNMGQLIAQRFRDEGAQVVVSGRHLNELERFAAEIQGARDDRWRIADSNQLGDRDHHAER
jgi:2-hydroxycyclohexanecarboxyl-CoA dehydrogenase